MGLAVAVSTTELNLFIRLLPLNADVCDALGS